ncbi:MAG: autotransporter outer membrane beta-barrel domain-containing protein [Gammaproteobacteria bacterium]|nr:autotransporter outer membrane beta-barrel domain-containing protein [Gammaproteobacteria bacterium]
MKTDKFAFLSGESAVAFPLVKHTFYDSKSMFSDDVRPAGVGQRMTADYYYSMMADTAGFGLLPDLGYRNTRQHQLNLDQQLLIQRFRKPRNSVFLAAGVGYSGIGGGTLKKDRRPSWDGFAGVSFANFERLEWGLGLSYSGGEYDASEIYMDTRNINLSAFSRWDNGTFFVDGGFTYAFVDYEDINRKIKALDVPLSKQEADTDGDVWSLFVRLGYDSVPHLQCKIGPFIALEYTRSEVDSFNEKRSKDLTYIDSGGAELDPFKIRVANQDRDYQRYRGGVFYNAAESAKWRWYGEVWLEHNETDDKSDGLIYIQSTVGNILDTTNYNGDNADFFQDGFGALVGVNLTDSFNISANVRLGEDGTVSGLNLYYRF